MPSKKRLNSVVHNIAHFVISGLSGVNSNLNRACLAEGVDCVVIELLESRPLPPGFNSAEDKSVLVELNSRLTEILLAEGFMPSVLVAARLTLWMEKPTLEDWRLGWDAFHPLYKPERNLAKVIRSFDTCKARLVDRQGNVYEDWVEQFVGRIFVNKLRKEHLARLQVDAKTLLLSKEESALVLYAAGLTKSRFWPFNRSCLMGRNAVVTMWR